MALDYITGDDASKQGPSEDTPEAGKQQTDRLAQSARLAAKWGAELAASKKWLGKFSRWARQCEKAYFDETEGASIREFGSIINLFWSNVQVVLSAIYGRLPKAAVDRKFKDFDDDVARVSASILQRILNADIERDHDDTAAAMRDAAQDRFVSGMGQVWCRYEVVTETYQLPDVDEMTGAPRLDAQGQPKTTTQERIISEDATVDYVYWDDFRYAPSRRWRDCRWVARRVYMGETKLRQRFKLDDKQASMIPWVTRTPGEGGGGNDDVVKATPGKQAAVWEIWDREANQVCWYIEGCAFVLDYDDDPLQLDDFFPCPQPIVATTLTKAFLPKPDYVMAQDLYKELDAVNAKLSKLQEAVKAAGVYDKNAGAVKMLLSSGVENTLIPVENWSSFVERGGMKGVVDWMPIDAIVNAITQLNQRKTQLQHDLYELLGISDIMRGASVASETATAQTLKVQYGGARLANLQNEIARFVSSVMKIRANIISKHFQPQTILQRSLIERTPDAPLAQQAIGLLKNMGMAMHQVTVTADSLAAPDWETEKEARSAFLGATSNFIMAAAPLVQANPTVGAFFMRLLQWAAAGFKGSQTIESALDQAAHALEAQAQQPPTPPEPSPEDKKNLATAKKSDAEAAKTGEEARRLKAENDIIIPPPPPPMGPMGPMGAMGPGGGGVPPMTQGGPQPAAMGPMSAMALPSSPMPGNPLQRAGMPAAPMMPPPLQPQVPLPSGPLGPIGGR